MLGNINLEALEGMLQRHQFVYGDTPSSQDLTVFQKLSIFKIESSHFVIDNYPTVFSWYVLVKRFSSESRDQWPLPSYSNLFAT